MSDRLCYQLTGRYRSPPYTVVLSKQFCIAQQILHHEKKLLRSPFENDKLAPPPPPPVGETLLTGAQGVMHMVLSIPVIQSVSRPVYSLIRVSARAIGL